MMFSDDYDDLHYKYEAMGKENESLRQQVKDLSEQVYQLRKELDATVKAATMMLGVGK
jgi:cell division septum initiation protein DivIVA